VPIPVPEPRLLDVPPLPPAPIAAVPPLAGAAPIEEPDVEPAAVEESDRPVAPPLGEPEGVIVSHWLLAGRPGAIVGWRANLLGVTAPAVAVEGRWPMPWLGAGWEAAARGGWWRERATVNVAGGPEPFDATADVLPIRALLTRDLERPWARLYAGAAVGVDVVVVRVPGQGALDASAALDVVIGAGRRVGPGEAFLELAGGLGRVDGPLARLRTGGLSLALGYRLAR
jgi:hypothetical protein